jgi:hypothetical protein
MWHEMKPVEVNAQIKRYQARKNAGLPLEAEDDKAPNLNIFVLVGQGTATVICPETFGLSDDLKNLLDSLRLLVSAADVDGTLEKEEKTTRGDWSILHSHLGPQFLYIFCLFCK